MSLGTRSVCGESCGQRTQERGQCGVVVSSLERCTSECCSVRRLERWENNGDGTQQNQDSQGGNHGCSTGTKISKLEQGVDQGAANHPCQRPGKLVKALAERRLFSQPLARPL